MRTRRMQRATGFTLTEILALLILMSAAGLLAMRLFVATTKLNDRAAKVHTQTVRMDAALRALRADVWGAGELSAADPASLTLTSAAGKVQWQIAHDGALLRTETRDGKTDQRRWPTAVPNSTIQVEGPIVTLIIPDTQHTRGGQIRFASQLRLAERLGS
jgi:type II secretory pathway pseudopilin PulG